MYFVTHLCLLLYPKNVCYVNFNEHTTLYVTLPDINYNIVRNYVIIHVMLKCTNKLLMLNMFTIHLVIQFRLYRVNNILR